MHVEQPRRAGALMQIVDILGDDQQPARPLPIKTGQRLMGGIRRDLRQFGPPFVIETVNRHRIARQRFGRADVFYPMPLP